MSTKTAHSPAQKIRFDQSQSLFFSTLRQRVADYFKENNLDSHANATMVLKTCTMLALFLTPYLLILSGWFSLTGMFFLCILMGIGTSGVGLSIMHDAIHGAYSTNPLINKVLGGTLYLLGGSPFTWRIQHNVLHHTYTNVYDFDEDIETKFILRLSPQSELKSYQKYQYLYAFPLYTLMTISMIVKDFIKVFRYNRKDFYVKSNSTTLKEAVILFVSKFVYFALLIGLPLWFLPVTIGQVLIGFLTLHFTAGFILSIIFQMAHIVEDTSHPQPDEVGNLENSWAIHQLNTTSNFAPNNLLLAWFAGGLNRQVEHHLFPQICHVHYPAIGKIVKATAHEFNLPYHEIPTFSEAIISHIKMLKRLGTEK